MTVRVSVTSNVDSVIDSIDDVKDDLYDEMMDRVGDAMDILQYRAKQYVQEDADYEGDLSASIHSSSYDVGDDIKFKVYTNSEIAPYAAIVEFGSGANTNNPWEGSEFPPKAEGMTTPGVPYSTPDIDTPPEADKYSLSGYPDYAGFVGYIEEWMQKKGVPAKTGDIHTSAAAISWEIINKGNLAHPFMRPAWFDTELTVRRAAKNAVRNATR